MTRFHIFVDLVSFDEDLGLEGGVTMGTGWVIVNSQSIFSFWRNWLHIFISSMMVLTLLPGLKTVDLEILESWGPGGELMLENLTPSFSYLIFSKAILCEKFRLIPRSSSYSGSLFRFFFLRMWCSFSSQS